MEFFRRIDILILKFLWASFIQNEPVKEKRIVLIDVFLGVSNNR